MARIDPPRAGTPERRAAFARGLSAESRAALLLIAKGYRIAARRWKSPVGEIDIVARRRILSAARAWLARHPDDATCAIRFDAVLVAPWRLPRHMPGAFDEDG